MKAPLMPSLPPLEPKTLIARLTNEIDHFRARAKRWTLAHRFWIGATVLLATFFIWMLWPRATIVDIAIIDRGEVRRDIVDIGRTRIHDTYIVSAPVSGELQRIDLEPGDPIARGQAIGEILPADPALLDERVRAEANAAIMAAQAALASANAQLELARRDQSRIARLAREDFASPAALDVANVTVRAARANATAAQAELQRARAAAATPNARARIATAIRSPQSGNVLRLLQRSETVIVAGTPILEIGDPTGMEVVAEFLSQDAVAMRPGDRAFIESWGGPPLPAHIDRIEPYAFTKISALGVGEQRVNVILKLDDARSAHGLGHGYRVDARVIVAQEENVLRAPTDALIRNGDQWSIYRIVNGRARLTPVRIGEGGADYRALVVGAHEGDAVIMFPGETLTDGARVRSASK